MAHKKAGGSTKNGRESESKRLGIKKFGGEHVLAGNILVRQRGTVYRAGDNVGTGTDVTIRELTETVAAVIGYRGRITWDASKPDGTPRKLMDVAKLSALGWSAKTGLREGIEKTYASFLAEKAAGTRRG